MSTASTMLQTYIEAETAILAGQSVRMNDRMLTRADLSMVQKGRREWQRIVDAENRVASGGSATRYQVPDFT